MGNISSRPEISGDISQAVADTTTSFPIKIGGPAKEFDGTDPGNVAEDQRISQRFTRDGRAYAEIGHPYFFNTLASYAAATTAAAPLINSPAVGTNIFITDLVLSSNTLATFTILQKVTAGANLIIMRTPAGGGHASHNFKQPIRASLADTTTAVVNIGLTTDVTVTSCFIGGFFSL